MNKSRRNFIKIGSSAAVFAGTNLLTSVFSSAQEKSAASREFSSQVLGDPLFGLTSENFKKYVGAEFILITDRQTVSATLSNVTQVTMPIKSKQTFKQAIVGNMIAENFMLSFQLSAKNFPQATYQFWHPNLGQFPLFLVPGERKKGQTFLHAVINRI